VGEKRWWVVVAGWVTRLLASPRLFEILTSRRAFIKRNAPSFSPLTSSAIMVEPPVIWRLMISACG
jgi:hypothetical protein